MNAKRSILVIVLALALSFSMVGMATASQTWYMLDIDSGATGADYEMKKGSGLGTGYKQIDQGQFAIWAADQSVAVDGGIDMSGDWTGNINLYVTPGGSSLKVEIGVFNTGSGLFTAAPAGTVSVTDSWWTSGFEDMSLASLSPSGFDLAKDEYLALKLTNTHDTNRIRIWSTDVGAVTSPSYLTFAGDDPAYPVPELSTLLLTCIGVLMLGGVIVYSRRRDKE